MSFAILLGGCAATGPIPQGPPLTVSWDQNILTIHGEHLPDGQVQVWYLEAYCKPGSTDRDWRETLIKHETTLVSADSGGRSLELRCELEDGVTVRHWIQVKGDTVEFIVLASNLTDTPSEVDWVQPCIRVGAFTGRGQEDYYERCFIFLDGRQAMMPTKEWETEARYTPGQVWAAPGVDMNDVNPRPLNLNRPSNGLIGAISADDQWILATAWEPWQELFQGVIKCIHNDFRIGGLEPGETKTLRGAIYIVPNDVKALLRRYERDFE